MAKRSDVLIVGGGIAGLLTAWYLARDGLAVTLLEAGDLAAQASGANAGSLHVQLQYPEFVKYGDGWARAYAPTLRFLHASIKLWEGLPDALGEDLDVKLGGGLVVARSAEQMRRIEAKALVEASVGVTTELLDTDDLRRIAPYLAEGAVGAGFCPREGKANPLRASPAVAVAAQRAGATILRDTPVTAIERHGGLYHFTTPRGTFTADRLVNCAGAQAGHVAAMLGMKIGIDGFPLQVTVTEPVAPTIPHLVYSAAGKLTLKQAANGGCIIGGGWAARQRTGGDLATDPGNLARNMGLAGGEVPALAQVRALRSWTAWVNGTPDWRPILGEAPGIPGFYLALFPWVGFSAAPMTARVTADLVMGRDPSMPLKGISVLAD